MIDVPDRAEANLSELLILVADRAEFSESELNTLDGQCPKETSQGVFVANVYEVVERGHDLYQVIGQGQQRPADQLPDIMDRLERERQI